MQFLARLGHGLVMLSLSKCTAACRAVVQTSVFQVFMLPCVCSLVHFLSLFIGRLQNVPRSLSPAFTYRLISFFYLSPRVSLLWCTVNTQFPESTKTLSAYTATLDFNFAAYLFIFLTFAHLLFFASFQTLDF